MRRRLLGMGAGLVLALLVGDVAGTLFVLPNYWRPVPPFGAITNPRQREWLEHTRAVLAGEAEPTGIGRFHRTLGWTTREGASTPDGRAHISSRGFRGAREVGDEPSEGVLRIAAFGDSFTFGDEVGDAETWAAQLEELVRDVEVLNLGVGGYGTDQATLRARLQLDELNADVAFLGLLLENIGRNVNRYRPRWYPNADSPVSKPRYAIREDGLWIVQQEFVTEQKLVDAISDGSVIERTRAFEYWTDPYVAPPLRWSSIARLLGARRAYAERSLERLWTDTEGEPFRVTVAIAERFCQIAKENGLDFAAVLVFPGREDLASFEERGTKYWSALFPALDERGVPYLDLSDALLAARRDGGKALYGDSHLSPAGNRVVAAALADALATRAEQEGR